MHARIPKSTVRSQRSSINLFCNERLHIQSHRKTPDQRAASPDQNTRQRRSESRFRRRHPRGLVTSDIGNGGKEVNCGDVEATGEGHGAEEHREAGDGDRPGDEAEFPGSLVYRCTRRTVSRSPERSGRIFFSSRGAAIRRARTGVVPGGRAPGRIRTRVRGLGYSGERSRRTEESNSKAAFPGMRRKQAVWQRHTQPTAAREGRRWPELS